MTSSAEQSLGVASDTESEATRAPEPTEPEDRDPGRPQKTRGVWGKAWLELRRSPLFLTSAVLILFVVSMAAFPWLYTSADPNAQDLSRSLTPPDFSGWGSAWFGYDLQGRDVYARTIYGARASLIVGLFATVGTLLLGGVVGLVAGYAGGKTDALLARVADVFFGLPFILGAIVILTTFAGLNPEQNVVKIMSIVIATIVVLSWPIAMRIIRSSAIATKQQDFVRAARGLGASPGRIIRQHVLPNSLAPGLVYGTIAFGSFVGAEASLSFLGVGLRPPVISWGVMISESRDYITTYPYLLFFPAAALVITVLAFVMLGDAVRDALDPKLR